MGLVITTVHIREAEREKMDQYIPKYFASRSEFVRTAIILSQLIQERMELNEILQIGNKLYKIIKK